MPVRKIIPDDYKTFKTLFCDYYTELDCEDDPLSLFNDYILPDLEAGLFDVGVCEVDGVLVGFAVYQIDDVINDWNFKEGCGDVREIYVAPAFRKRGFGSELLHFAEAQLKAGGADSVYTLPTEDSELFFKKCGYTDNGGYCPDLDNKVFEKILP